MVVMFHVHSAVAWMSPNAKQTLYFKYAMKISGMVAPVFMFLAGISMTLVTERLYQKGVSVVEIRKRIAKRGLQIVAMGYGLHLFFYLLSGHYARWIRVFKVDILHCIGLSMVITACLIRPRRAGRVNFSALAIFVGAPLLSMVLYRLPVDAYLPAPIAAYFSTTTRLSLFPVIPYISWICLGLVVAPFFISADHNERQRRRFWIGLALWALALWFAGLGLKSLYYLLCLDTLGTTTPQVKGILHFFFLKGAFVLGLFLFFGTTARLFDRFPKPFWVRFGKFSLFAYCVHLAIIYPFFGSSFRRRLSVFPHMAATLSLTIVMLGLVMAYDRLKQRYPRLGRLAGRG